MSPTPVYLYVTDTFADWEPGYAIAHILKPSWQRTPGRYTVRTVSATDSPVTSMGGMRVLPDTTLAEISPAASAMLILPGGETWDDAASHREVLATARAFLDAGTPVAAICGATYGLAVAGLLEGREHTSSAAGYLASSGYAAGYLYRDAPAVTDRGLITAGSIDPVPFATHIFAALELYEPRVLEAWSGLFTTGDEKYFAALAAAA
ncbi:MAG TPA: DJ-1/PfpI family protein [Solirubrobacteraceae bacterium]